MPLSDRFEKWRCSSCHWVVRRVITDADRPADEPKNPPSAGAKSPLDMPARYINGNTSVTFGDLRHHGGTIELLNWQPLTGLADRLACRSPGAPRSRCAPRRS